MTTDFKEIGEINSIKLSDAFLDWHLLGTVSFQM